MRRDVTDNLQQKKLWSYPLTNNKTNGARTCASCIYFYEFEKQFKREVLGNCVARPPVAGLKPTDLLCALLEIRDAVLGVRAKTQIEVRDLVNIAKYPTILATSRICGDYEGPSGERF